MPQQLWDRVQAQLASRDQVGARGRPAKNPSLLTGLLHDGLGRRMTPSHANKQGKRYRYYITHDQQRQRGEEPAWRVPAHDLEQIVIDRLRCFLADDSAIHEVIGVQDADTLQACLALTRTSATLLGNAGAEELRATLKQHVMRIDLCDDHIDIVVRLSELFPELDGSHTLSVPVERVRRSQAVKLILPGPEPIPTRADPRLIGLIAEAHLARKHVLERSGSLAQIAAQLGKCRGHLADMMRLSYIAPDIVAAILEGRQPASLNRKTLAATALSPDWNQQRHQLGFA